jgi:hypothetical protein
MSSKPNPARIAQYEARLAELIDAREAFRTQRNAHKVRILNRQIRAQLKWLKKVRAQQRSERVGEHDTTLRIGLTQK